VAKLPRVGGKEMLRFLEREGFAVLRVRGSHHFLNRGEVDVVVPVHANRSLKTGTLRRILRTINPSPDEFAHRLKQ
jgi:predicted RNA binding protein YcfA (HicA-like mRNA interferase family)